MIGTTNDVEDAYKRGKADGARIARFYVARRLVLAMGETPPLSDGSDTSDKEKFYVDTIERVATLLKMCRGPE